MDNKYRCQARYDKANTRQVKLKLNIETDADVLGWLDSQQNKQGAIKELIRSLIRQEEEEEL